jgi:hypothetical protein
VNALSPVELGRNSNAFLMQIQFNTARLEPVFVQSHGR